MLLTYKSRYAVSLVTSAVLVELLLMLDGGRAFQIAHDGSLWAVPIAVPFQFIPAALLTYITSSPLFEQEQMAAVDMRKVHTFVLGTSLSLVLMAATILSSQLGDSGNVGSFTPLRALIGFMGIGLIATCLVDRRIACLFPAIALLLPFTLNPVLLDGEDYWAFATVPSHSVASWCFAIALFGVGFGGSVFWSEGQRR